MRYVGFNRRTAAFVEVGEFESREAAVASNINRDVHFIADENTYKELANDTHFTVTDFNSVTYQVITEEEKLKAVPSTLGATKVTHEQQKA